MEIMGMNTLELPPIERPIQESLQPPVMAAMTHQGLIREDNQDAFIIDPDGRFAIVADGMGGHEGGALASRTASAAVAAALDHPFDDDRHDALAEKWLRTGFGEAFEALSAKALKNPDCGDMGTTLLATAFCRHDGELVVAHLGDSRLYRLRDGRLTQLTDDHNVLAELRRAGVLNEETEAENHHLAHLLTRAVSPGATDRPDIFRAQTHPGDRYLLCSDGLHGVVAHDKIATLLGQDCDLETICQDLIDASLDGGAPDNVTVALLDFAKAQDA